MQDEIMRYSPGDKSIEFTYNQNWDFPEFGSRVTAKLGGNLVRITIETGIHYLENGWLIGLVLYILQIIIASIINEWFGFFMVFIGLATNAVFFLNYLPNRHYEKYGEPRIQFTGEYYYNPDIKGEETPVIFTQSKVVIPNGRKLAIFTSKNKEQTDSLYRGELVFTKHDSTKNFIQNNDIPTREIHSIVSNWQKTIIFETSSQKLVPLWPMIYDKYDMILQEIRSILRYADFENDLVERFGALEYGENTLISNYPIPGSQKDEI